MNPAHRREFEAVAPSSCVDGGLRGDPGSGDKNAKPLKPDPKAHAEILVVTYGMQTAAWIAETNLATARQSDTPYWGRVLQTVKTLRASATA